MVRQAATRRERSAAARRFRADRRERITQSLLDAAGNLARSCEASAILVSVEALRNRILPLPQRRRPRVIHVTRAAVTDATDNGRDAVVLRVPDVPLTRMAQVRMAVFLALSQGLVAAGDVLVCLTGPPDGGTLDTVAVVDVGEEFAASLSGPLLPADLRPEVLERVVSIASQLGSEGREGRPVGAVFVIGDTPRVLAQSRQMILNPFRGHPEDHRKIGDPGLDETIKELSILDGAFVIRGDGVIEACAVCLEVEHPEHCDLPRGLGARHYAAAAITASTDSIAVTVSESTGAVTLFRSGRIITTLKRPRPSGPSVYPERDGEE